MNSNLLRPFSLTLLLSLSAPFFVSASEYYTNWASTRFTDVPSQAGPSSDPDADGDANLVEFAFGTDPRVTGGIIGAVNPISGLPGGTNVAFSVNILEQAGRQPGAQIDLSLSSNLAGTNWFRPWWLRVPTNSQPSDPAGSIRENFTTRMPDTNVWFVRSS